MAEHKVFKIRIDNGAFDKDIQRANISTEKREFNRDVYNSNKAVEELDRYDDFGFFKIDPGYYAQTNRTGEYGIPIKRGLNDDVILAHQRVAALSFLRDLRGFGLLADVVGSGKTFEACVVLSELAARGKLKSMLLVVPDQVFDSWKTVLEMRFGLGKGVLQEIGKDVDISELECESLGDILRPRRPMIVKTEDFADWPEATKNLLFDVIVVDEAHHLCVEEGRYAKAMKLLSQMIQTKKKENSTYCLLLSATPHTGNLEHMFRLWYFIRCGGGNPSDFDEKDDSRRTEQYRKEKEYYKNHVCYGAATVMEFIKKVKMNVVREDYDEEFAAYLRQKGESGTYESKTEGEKFLLVQEFLDADNHAEIRSAVLDRVASAYHNGVLRSIMIRQPNTIAKRKVLQNFFFFPMQTRPGILETSGLDGKDIEVDLAHLYGDGAIKTRDGKMSLKKYLEDHRGNKTYRQAYAEFLSRSIINSLEDSEGRQIISDENVFKVNSATYYGAQMMRIEPYHEVPKEMTGIADPEEYRLVPYQADDGFAHKVELVKKILQKHEKRRVLVFFDYDVKDPSAVAKRFEAELAKDAKFKDRLLTGGATGKSATVEKFDKKSDAVLVVEDASFTEGVNLQKSSVIINFEVTPDPLSMDQRIGRIFRLGQDESNVLIYSLADMDKLEGYVLMYFLRIGLMSSNSGDATIIAGSNSERMVTVRCPVCKSVALYSLEDYEAKKKANDLYCTKERQCMMYDPRGTLMEEISVYDFKCNKCDLVFTRSIAEEGYMCIAANSDSDRGIMCNSGEKDDRSVYCSKLCAMRHCGFFKEKLKKDPKWCSVLAAYRENPTIGEGDLAVLCFQCENRDACPSQCRWGTGREAIEGCSTCDRAQCHPKPHVLAFNDKWEAACPACDGGTLSPIVARTFAAYIRAAWKYEHDGGAAFCANLLAEANKVADIREILAKDKTE